MLNNLILIENGRYKQFLNEKKFIQYLLGDNYYSLSEKERIKLMQANALAKCYGTNIKILKLLSKEMVSDINNKFILYDEKTFVLSLLLTNRVMLLERRDSNIYTNNIDKSGFKENYIIVNNFAEKILETYIKSINNS